MNQGFMLLAFSALIFFSGCRLGPEPRNPAPPSPAVDERLIGTWRSFDIQSQTFDPLSSADITITATTFTWAGITGLPHPDCAVVVSGGEIGERDREQFFRLMFYTFDEINDYLIVHAEPNPTIATAGAAVYKRL